MALHACPGPCTNMIPDEKFLCNLDADKTPAALMMTCALAFDTGSVVGLSLALAPILTLLKSLKGTP